MRPVTLLLLLLAPLPTKAGGDTCSSFVVKVDGDRLDLAPPRGFVDVCSQDAEACQALTRGYPAGAPTLGYFVTAAEWAQLKKTRIMPGFTSYFIAQLAKGMKPDALAELKKDFRSSQGNIPDHTKLPEMLKVEGEVNLGVVDETADSILFGKVAKLQIGSGPTREATLVALNAAFVLGPHLFSLYSFRTYRSEKDIDAAKRATIAWLRCMRAANSKPARPR